MLPERITLFLNEEGDSNGEAKSEAYEIAHRFNQVLSVQAYGAGSWSVDIEGSNYEAEDVANDTAVWSLIKTLTGPNPDMEALYSVPAFIRAVATGLGGGGDIINRLVLLVR